MAKPTFESEDDNKRYFIEMMAAFINGRKPEATKPVDWDRLFQFAQKHSMAGLLGYMAQYETSEFKPDEETKKKLLGIYVYTLQAHGSREHEHQLVIGALNRNGIPHILIKGSVLQHYYPLAEIRTMGDLDLGVRVEDIGKTDGSLKELGFTLDNTVGYVREYSKGGVSVEIHTRLVSSSHKKINDKLTEYFGGGWEHAFPTGQGESYELEPEYHLLYLLSHIAKHFRSNGCGARMLLDIAVFLKHFEGKLDFVLIGRELEKLGMTHFAATIFGLCDAWFGVKAPVGGELPPNIYHQLSSFILDGGTFGDREGNIVARRYRIEYEKNTGKRRLLLRTSSLIRSIFPSAANLKYYYPDADKGFPWYFIGWFVKLYCLLFKRRKFSKKILSDIKSAPEEAEKMYEFLRTIGL
jgi:hypothetical protein